MRKLLLAFLVLMNLNNAFAQDAAANLTQKNASIHKIVFQLSTEDTLAHKALMKQLNNITTVAPDTKIEVVCHGPGLNMLISSKTTVLLKIRELVKKDIQFVACEFSMKERNVDKTAIVQESGFVKAGIIEIVEKQEAGWSYIKSGF
jgi:intracellular sulfur oxidation DsrE/DsrF family protein